MTHRIDYSKAAPEGYKAFGGVYAQRFREAASLKR